MSVDISFNPSPARVRRRIFFQDKRPQAASKKNAAEGVGSGGKVGIVRFYRNLRRSERKSRDSR